MAEINLVHFIYRSTGTVLTLYFLGDASTDAVGSIGKTKAFLDATYIIQKFTMDNQETPTDKVKTILAFTLDRVQAITRFGPVPVSNNWFLDTIQGQAVLGIIALVVLVVLLVVVVVVAKHASKW
jgi:hypothetical protein